MSQIEETLVASPLPIAKASNSDKASLSHLIPSQPRKHIPKLVACSRCWIEKLKTNVR